MDCVLVSSLIWLCVLLQCIFTPISLCQTQETQTLEGRSWSDIYNRSKCQPRWVLLNLLHEFPQFSEFLFKPACVSVQRCAGCCLDEAQSCYPLQSQIVKMEVQRTKSFQEEYTNISVIQHTDCECRLVRCKKKRGCQTRTRLWNEVEGCSSPSWGKRSSIILCSNHRFATTTVLTITTITSINGRTCKCVWCIYHVRVHLRVSVLACNTNVRRIREMRTHHCNPIYFQRST
ncbi:uncharacterized protein [Pyxicephalus adspersus]|uniref:uncharacterized protein isoform X1 n=1 Tax=Pyxicephalus adspersus TaxID=30357 RepID=UPI003B5C4C90